MPEQPDSINYLCLVCGEPSYFASKEAIILDVCPYCGDPGLPANLDDTVTVTLTSHELRILAFWADNCAQQARRLGMDPSGRYTKMIQTIRDRLSMQTSIPLSLAQEMADIRQHIASETAETFDVVIFDPITGTCLECGEQIETEDLFDHTCNRPKIDVSDLPPLETTDERGTEEESN